MLRILRSLGFATLAVVMSLTAMSSVAHAGSAADTTPTPVGGGTGIVFQRTLDPDRPTGYYVCTLTAVGRDAAGNLVALTNAHCFYDDQGNKLVGLEVYRDASPAGTATAPAPLEDSRPDLETGAIGTVTYVSTPNNLLNLGPKGLDYAVVRLDESAVAATDTVGDVVVKDIGAPPANGTRMCKQGHRTGLTCGIKLGTHGIWFTHLIWTDGGDSGSPVVFGQTLVGNAWGAQHSSPIVDILADMNANGGVGAGFHLAS